MCPLVYFYLEHCTETPISLIYNTCRACRDHPERTLQMTSPCLKVLVLSCSTTKRAVMNRRDLHSGALLII